MRLPRVYAVLDTAALDRWNADPVAVAGAMLDAGIRLLQFRHKGAFPRAVYQQAAAVAELCRQAGATYFIDDRADIALLAGAGVHVGQQDLPPTLVRRVLPTGLVGLSTHNEAQLRAGDAEPVDYLAIGPVFATGSKRNPDPVVGTAQLARLRALTRKPLVAIGGITHENAGEVFAAGIDSVAVIGGLLSGGPDAASIRRSVTAFLRW